MASVRKRRGRSGQKPSGYNEHRSLDVRLTTLAERDLANILAFGIEQFGISAARDYFSRLERRFEHIAENPLQFPSAEHIRSGYRRSVCGAHSIYFKATKNRIEIIRILGRQTFSDPD